MLSIGIVSATTSQVLMTKRTDFALKLRWWREHRGLSQLELSGRAGISQRHLSFLELGRASASRQMVLRLAEALDVPLAAAQRPAVGGWLRAGLARDGARSAGARAGRAALSTTCWRSRSPFPPLRSTGTGNCSRPTPEPFAWWSSWSGRCLRAFPSIWPTPWSHPTCCDHSWSIGRRWCATSSAAWKPTRPPTAATRRVRSWKGCWPTRACERP